MRIVIVGHGPSLKGAKKGELIDSHDYVVRMKSGQRLCRENPEDYGTKSSFIVASTEVLGTFKNSYGAMLLAYPKLGWYSDQAVRKASEVFKSEIIVPLNLCNYWNWTFRNMGARHPNVSTGTAAIIMIASHFIGAAINLAGFDTLLDPSKPFTRITEVPRTGSGDFPDHDWETEKKLLGKIEHEYKVKIKPLW